MKLEKLKSIAEELKAFGIKELEKAKEIKGFSMVSFKIVSKLIQDIVAKVDDIKAEFKDISNKEMQTLAVDAVMEAINWLIATRLGSISKLIYKIFPTALKREIAKVIVDLVVNAVHRTADKVKEALAKKKKK